MGAGSGAAGSTLLSADLIYPATPNPRFIPDVEGVYALSLVVSDGISESAPDFVTLTVATGNQSPVVDAGPSQTITPCHANPILLDGSGSHDPEQDPFTWQWSVLTVPYGSLVTGSSLTTPQAATTPVKLDLYGLYVFGLTLDDGKSPPSLGTVAVLFDNGSTQAPPVADAGGNRTARAQATCTADGCGACHLTLPIDGTASVDPNGDPLAFHWTVVEGEGTFSDAGASIPELTGPTLTPPGAGRSISSTVKVQLTVADCVSESAPSLASITFTCEGE